MKYEYGKIDNLHKALETEGIDEKCIAAIMEGGEKIRQRDKAQVKADWLKGAMMRLAEHVPASKIQPIRESCACCTGGKRDKESKAILKNNPDLKSRVEAANKNHFVFGHSVKQLANSSFEVCFFTEQQAYRCPCLRNVKGAFPISYCMCCGGHVKHHLQNALGLKLKVKVKQSVLSSGGSKPCTFILSEDR